MDNETLSYLEHIANKLYPSEHNDSKGMANAGKRKIFIEGATVMFNSLSPYIAKNLYRAVELIDDKLIEDPDCISDDAYWTAVCQKYTELISK